MQLHCRSCLRQPGFQAYGNCQGRSSSLSEIMQIVTSAVRIDVALTLSRSVLVARRRSLGAIASKQIFCSRGIQARVTPLWVRSYKTTVSNDVVKACRQITDFANPNAVPSDVWPLASTTLLACINFGTRTCIKKCCRQSRQELTVYSRCKLCTLSAHAKLATMDMSHIG